MPVTPSKLRADIYNLIDRVLETGEPLEIVRHGQVLRLVPPARPGRSWVDRLPRRDGVVRGDPEALVHCDWSDTWSAELP